MKPPFQNYLTKYNYFGTSSQEDQENEVTQESYERALIKFQSFVGIPITGI